MEQLIGKRDGRGGGEGGEDVAAVASGRRASGRRVPRPRKASPPLLTQPRAEPGRYELLDAHAFRNAVSAYLAGDRAPCFTLVVLKPNLPAKAVRLAEVVLSTLRAESGDLAGKLEGALAVFLHTARRREVGPFLQRVSSEWRRVGGDRLMIEIAAHPTEECRVIDLLAADWAERPQS